MLNNSLQQPSYKPQSDFQNMHSGLPGPGGDMMQSRNPPVRASNPGPGAQRGPVNYFNRTPSPNLENTFPPGPGAGPANRPRPAPRPPRMAPSPPKPQQRQTPSPPANRPISGSRESLLSPPSSDQSSSNRPDSAGNKPPG